jgi:outer membrane protein assembly factor BamB
MSDCPPASDGTRIFCDYAAPAPGADRAHVGAPAVEHLYAIDAKSGALRWDEAYADGNLPEWNEAAIPLVYNRVLYVGSSLGPQISAFDASSGRMLWKTSVRGAVKGGICGEGGALYFGDYAGYLWALDARSGRVVGVKNMHTVFNVGSPLIAGQTLVVGTYTGQILAVPLKDIRSSHDA